MSYSTVLLEWSNWIWRAAFNHLWQATLFFAIAFAVSLLLRRGSARGRYVLWLAVSLKFALPLRYNRSRTQRSWHQRSVSC
jgi:hypothetical protein